jgi:hypothetical protein
MPPSKPARSPPQSVSNSHLCKLDEGCLPNPARSLFPSLVRPLIQCLARNHISSPARSHLSSLVRSFPFSLAERLLAKRQPQSLFVSYLPCFDRIYYQYYVPTVLLFPLSQTPPSKPNQKPPPPSKTPSSKSIRTSSSEPSQNISACYALPSPTNSYYMSILTRSLTHVYHT